MIRWSCACCQRCWLIPKAMTCVYGGPYEGYDFTHLDHNQAGDARERSEPCEAVLSEDTTPSGK